MIRTKKTTETLMTTEITANMIHSVSSVDFSVLSGYIGMCNLS